MYLYLFFGLLGINIFCSATDRGAHDFKIKGPLIS